MSPDAHEWLALQKQRQREWRRRAVAAAVGRDEGGGGDAHGPHAEDARAHRRGLVAELGVDLGENDEEWGRSWVVVVGMSR